MLTLTLALVGQTVELRSGPVGLESQLSGLLNSMRVALEQDARSAMPMRPSPTRTANPCATDIQKLRCSDSACLKRNAESLAPACAALLLGAPEPSPAPEPHSESAGHYTLISQGSDGQMHRSSGPIGLQSLLGMPMGAPRSASMRPMMAGNLAELMPGLAMPMLRGFMPPELASLLASPRMQLLAEPEEEEEEEPRHPCAREVAACTREAHAPNGLSRTDLEQCLVRHLQQLSPDCQCFVHHVTGGRLAAMHQQPHASLEGAARQVPTVVITEVPPPTVTVTVEVDDPEMPPPHHRVSCLLVFTALFLLTFLLARAFLMLLCCGSKAKRVVVVPPEHAKISVVGPRAVDIVQVAEPVKKDRA